MRFALLLSLPLCLTSFAAGAEAVSVDEPRCEYLNNPLGIDRPQPRLSWKIHCDVRGAKQTAYQVLVASSPELLAKNQGDLWDSGRVVSDQSIHVPYAGKPLVSRQRCFWKVCVWCGDSSAWSEPAVWSMGLLAPADWEAKWIGLDANETRAVVQNTNWIWYPEEQAPPGKRYFRRVIDVPEGRRIKSASLLTAADDAANVFVNGVLVGRAVTFKVALESGIADQLKPGKNVLAIVVENGGNEPNPAGLLALLTIEFADGQPMVIATDPSWKSADQEAAGWDQPAFDDSAWKAAKVLGAPGMAPWGEIAKSDNRRLAARWLRKEFPVERKVRRATVYFSGLGLSELYVNGKKVGDEVLSPGLTEYPKRVFYVTHDVTDLLRSGANAVGVALGNGRYYAPRLDSPTPTVTYGYPKLLLQMEIEYDDGSVQKIFSDDAWRLTTDGPIVANNEYDGEEYDSLKELRGWAEPGFDASKWQTPQMVAAPGGVLAAEMAPPIRVTETIKPVAVSSPKPGVYIFDMGQNMVGWCRIRVKGPRGTEVVLRHAERLESDGTLYLANIRGAKVTDRYVLRGEGQEQWEPRFTYHGFRYVEVTGWPGEPTLDSLEGRIVHDDMPSGGTWSCSNSLVNRIYKNIYWGVRGNYRSIPTDCPQRDERQGWTGDRAAESRGETYLFQNAPLYANWLQDMADSQKESGSVPDVTPAYWPFYSDNVTWPCCLVVIPGALLDQFGDTAVIARAYPAADKWMTFMSGFLKNDIMPNDTYGDWCVPPEDPKLIHSNDPARKTAKEVLGTTYFYHCCRLMARYAALLEKTDDARRYNDLAERLKTAFNRDYLKPSGDQYDNGSQTSCVLPLSFGMVPEANRDKVFAHLVDKISHESHDHVGTGLIGGQWLMRTLTANGRPDLAYTLVSQKTYPSWGYMVEQDATTVWELWNGDTADPAMNSGNHVMLVGDLTTWLNEDLAGIKPDPEQPGFKHIVMRPQIVGDLTHVEATHESMYGRIRSAWKLADGDFQWTVAIPANTTATVYLPTAAPDRVFEGDNIPVEKAAGVQLVGQQGDRTVVRIGAGEYHFVVKGRK